MEGKDLANGLEDVAGDRAVPTEQDVSWSFRAIRNLPKGVGVFRIRMDVGHRTAISTIARTNGCEFDVDADRKGCYGFRSLAEARR
jgi:hypothetical protein